jgi:hypothetical protein
MTSDIRVRPAEEDKAEEIERERWMLNLKGESPNKNFALELAQK